MSKLEHIALRAGIVLDPEPQSSPSLTDTISREIDERGKEIEAQMLEIIAMCKEVC